MSVPHTNPPSPSNAHTVPPANRERRRPKSPQLLSPPARVLQEWVEEGGEPPGSQPFFSCYLPPKGLSGVYMAPPATRGLDTQIGQRKQRG
mmetsp:Transcript_3477/g.6696  ORF Transcript_3477/g.6696 Transcript_3477/m.6696 type:complete len:91 (+) Transcript_3477:914-1186(+)